MTADNPHPELRESYVRNGYVFDLYDGDTVYYHADLGYNVWAAFLTGRLLDVQAPELRPLSTRESGVAAKLALWEYIGKYALNKGQDTQAFGALLRIMSVTSDNKWFSDQRQMRQGKFGRWLVTLVGADEHGEPVNINELMVTNGYAKPYEDHE